MSKDAEFAGKDVPVEPNAADLARQHEQFCALTLSYAADRSPRGATEQWIAACRGSLAEFVRRFPTDRDRRRLLRRLARTRKAVGAAVRAVFGTDEAGAAEPESPHLDS